MPLSYPPNINVSTVCSAFIAKMVASGADEFGLLGGPDTLLVARSKGHPLVAIAVLHRDSNFPVIKLLKTDNVLSPERSFKFIIFSSSNVLI